MISNLYPLFWYADYTKLPSSFRQPHSVHCPPGSPHPAHSSKTNEVRNIQGSIKTAFVSTFLSWPSLINYILCVVLVVAACYLLQCGQPTRPTETKSSKSKQRNDNDDRYLILELLELGNTGYQLAPLPGTSWLVGRIGLVGRIYCKFI